MCPHGGDGNLSGGGNGSGLRRVQLPLSGSSPWMYPQSGSGFVGEDLGYFGIPVENMVSLDGSGGIPPLLLMHKS